MKIQITGSKVARIVRYFAVYLLLLLTSGFNIYAQGYHIPWMLITASVFFLLSKKRVDLNVMLTAIAMFLLIVISGAINNEKSRNIIVPSMDILCALLIAFSALSGDEKYNFIDLYRQVVLIIAIASLILFTIGALVNSLFSIFPEFTQGRHTAYFAGLSFIYKNRQYLNQRNMGIFWEPGAFQTYLIVAMILEDSLEKNHKLRNLIIYSITILTTVSTTGIVCMLLFWILYVLKAENRKSGFVIALVLLLCVALLVFHPEVLPDALRTGIVEKISDLFSGDAELRTVQTRMDSIVYPLQAFWENPLFGVSKSGMYAWRSLTGHGLNTCTPINWFAHYGIFMGVIILVGFGKFFSKISAKRWVGLAMLVIFLVSISTEAFNYNPTLLCFAFMGISSKKDLLSGGNSNENISD